MKSREKGDTELPLSWSESERSVLKLNMRHLCLFGAWPLSRYRIFHVYSVINLALGIWYVNEGSTYVSYIWGDMEEATLVLISTFNIGSIVVKTTLFLWHRGQYFALVRRVDDLMLVQSEPCSEDPVLGHLLWRSKRTAVRLTTAMLLLMVSQYVTWYPMPLIMNWGERRLPLAQHPWDNNSNYYVLSYAAQCIAVSWMTQISFGIDCLFVSIMILVAAQMKILASRVASLKMQDDGLSRKQHIVKSPRYKLYRDLCLCIETHQQLLRFIRELEDAMSPIVLTQFACSVLVTCVTLFPAVFSTDFTAVIRSAGFLPVPLGQPYLYCWGAHTVTEQAEAVSAAAYSCAWMEANESFKRALRILISRAQKPLVITAGHLYPINRPAFVSLVNASYTYYALLCQFNKRAKERAL
ncbi:odorant receptor Or2-like [Schistocerca americana]|uniref:odorant receptor Or2-like n=1 Tax=Schistocerca americana TaxID=7009 RepID=UPI001F4F16D7|nr:odorant receptor Or2-like [Schistocerca americana]